MSDRMKNTDDEIDALMKPSRFGAWISKWIADNPFVLVYELLCALAASSAFAIMVGYVDAEPLRLVALAALSLTLAALWRFRRYLAAWWESVNLFERLFWIQMSPWLSFPAVALLFYLFDIQPPMKL